MIHTVVDLKLAYFTHSCMRGFVATRPPYSDVYHCYVYICGVQSSAEHFLFRICRVHTLINN